jgi:hypothetical protein
MLVLGVVRTALRRPTIRAIFLARLPNLYY